jgi:ring-1,2-phenylacetyl-CoA epoxidase subunit PaaE
MQYKSVTILDVIHETKDAITICFDPKETPEDFLQFIPGQQISLRVFINFKEYRRSYSICSALHENSLKVTVKKLSKGVVSNHLVDTLKPGDHLEISKPEGHFCIHPSIDKRQNYFFFAAGSGITPIFSMIKSLLENEPKSILHLLYGNRTEDDIIFYKEIESLLKKYEGQLHVDYTLSKVKSKLLPFLSSSKDTWKGWKGRIDESMIKRFMENYPERNSSSSYYICGPGDLIESTKSSLIHLNIDAKLIHAEYFTSPASAVPEVRTVSTSEVTLIVHLNDKRHEFQMPGNKKVLDFLIDKGLDPPYSCSSGACATCMAKIIQGEVKMDIALALEPEEIAEGYILTCQSRPASPVLEIKY